MTIMNCKKLPLAASVGGATGPHEVVEMWCEHYKKLFNSVADSSVKDWTFDIAYDDLMRVTANEIHDAISSLPYNKAAGSDNLCSENLKYCSKRLPLLLSMLFTSLLVHGHLPEDLPFLSKVIPVIKNKSGDISERNNYRPIAIACVISKVLEIILLSRCEEYLTTTDYQFGFKSKHSTDMCIYTLKIFVHYYSFSRWPYIVIFEMELN